MQFKMESSKYAQSANIIHYQQTIQFSYCFCYFLCSCLLLLLFIVTAATGISTIFIFGLFVCLHFCVEKVYVLKGYQCNILANMLSLSQSRKIIKQKFITFDKMFYFFILLFAGFRSGLFEHPHAT